MAYGDQIRCWKGYSLASIYLIVHILFFIISLTPTTVLMIGEKEITRIFTFQDYICKVLLLVFKR